MHPHFLLIKLAKGLSIFLTKNKPRDYLLSDLLFYYSLSTWLPLRMGNSLLEGTAYSLFHLWELRLFLYPNLLKWSPCQSQAPPPPLPSLPETHTVRPFRLLPSLVSRGHFLCQSPRPALPTKKHDTSTSTYYVLQKYLLCVILHAYLPPQRCGMWWWVGGSSAGQ